MGNQEVFDQARQADEAEFKGTEPIDSGRFLGLGALVGVGVIAVGFAAVFPHSYVREVNGPIASLFIAIAAGILWGATYYASSGAKDPDLRNKISGFKGTMVFGLASGCIAATASYAYRGQTGGLEVNGIEASVAILAWFIFCAIVQKIKIKLGDQ